MSNDSFIREVNEELRQDRVRTLWTRFGAILIAAAVLIVLGTVGYVLWERHRASVAAADGDVFLAAAESAAAGRPEEAIASLEELAETGVGVYPELARLRLASLRQNQGDAAGAIEALDAVATDSSVPQPMRDIAAVRAAYILVDTGTVDDVRQRVERLTNGSEPLRHAAREAIGLAAWKAGDTETAETFFTEISEDLSAPQGISQRAAMMLELIAGGVPFDPSAAGGAQTEAPVAPAPASDAPAQTNVPDAAAPAEPDAAAPPAPAGEPTGTTPPASPAN